MEEKVNTNHTKMHKHNIHHVLARSYTFYFLALLFGVSFDLFFPLDLLGHEFAEFFGVGLIFLASFLIFWAQHTSRKLHKNEITKESFAKGPYRFIRTPTHFGLFLLLFGFSFVLNTFFLALFSFVSFLLTKFIYIRKQEEILHHKYGEPYDEYKKMVRI